MKKTIYIILFIGVLYALLFIKNNYIYKEVNKEQIFDIVNNFDYSNKSEIKTHNTFIFYKEDNKNIIEKSSFIFSIFKSKYVLKSYDIPFTILSYNDYKYYVDFYSCSRFVFYYKNKGLEYHLSQKCFNEFVELLIIDYIKDKYKIKPNYKKYYDSNKIENDNFLIFYNHKEFEYSLLNKLNKKEEVVKIDFIDINNIISKYESNPW